MMNRFLLLLLFFVLTVQDVYAVIAFDAATNSTANTGDFSFNHTPAGTPRGVLVLIVQAVGITDEVVGVTYGGVTMTEVALSPMIQSSGAELGVIYGYFLGSSVPTGVQSVAVDVNATGSNKIASVFTVTASTDTAVEDTSSLNNNGAIDPSVNVTLGTVKAFIAGALKSGAAVTDVSSGSGYTQQYEYDFSFNSGNIEYRTAIAQGPGDFAVGWTATSDEQGILAVALKQTSENTSTSRKVITE